ncbi:hypothetical protein ACFE04_019836 [Oxalis oulophora]
MNATGTLFAFCALLCSLVNAAPVKRIDQRQDGDLNIQAHLDKIVLLIVPNKNINILDIKGQGAFDQYEDILPLLGKENVLNDLKYKLSHDDLKIKTLIGADLKDEKKETPLIKIESKVEPKESKEAKKPEVREAPKKVDEPKAQPEPQKKIAPKSDGRTYHTVQSGNNRERVIAISSHELEQRKAAADLPLTTIEKL